MKRNHVTTNAKRQMQRVTPHRRWESSAAHVAYQRAAKWFGANSREAQAALDTGLVAGVRKHVLKRKPVAAAMERLIDALSVKYPQTPQFGVQAAEVRA